MVFPSLGNNLSRESVLGKNSQIGRGFGTIVSRKRHRRTLKETSKEVVMRTFPLLVRQGKVKERVPKKRVKMMEEHHNWERKRT